MEKVLIWRKTLIRNPPLSQISTFSLGQKGCAYYEKSAYYERAQYRFIEKSIPSGLP